MRPVRVLLAPRNISGQSTEYAAALRPYGVAAQVWSIGEAAFGFPADRVLDRDRLLADPMYRWQVLDSAVRGFDVFHFQYGRSLLTPNEPVLPELWDLPLLRSLGKKVFMHWRGSDVRLKSVHVQREPHSYLRDVPCDEDAIRRRVSIARRYADRMFVSTPGLLDYVPDALWIPHVVDAAAWRTERGPEPAVPTVVHLPSQRAAKASDAVDAALRPLHEEGSVEYRPASRLDREGVRRLFQSADIVVDSLTIGDHGLVSVEAMAAGAVAVAHIHEANRARNPGVPVVEADPASLRDVVRRLAADPAERARLRTAGVEWVHQRHDRPVVGRLLAELYAKPSPPVRLGHPEWPRSDSRARLDALEAEVERLRALTAGSRAATPRPTPRPTLRERIEARPSLHLALRRADTRLRRLRERWRGRI